MLCLRHEGKYINGSGAIDRYSGIPINGRDSTHVVYYFSGEKHASFFYKNYGGKLKRTRVEEWYKNGVKSRTSEFNYRGVEHNVLKWDEKGLPIKK